MKIAIIGRTSWLLDAAKNLVSEDLTIALVASDKEEAHYACTLDDFRSFSTHINCPFVVGLKALKEQLEITSCDIAISVNWPSILNAGIIGQFRLGILNAHAGDLPKYRGNACPNWAILNGETEIGLTTHLMVSDKVDAGPIVMKRYFPVTEDTYIQDVYMWLDKNIPPMLAESALGLLKGELTPEKQPENDKSAVRCYPRRPIDSHIDWRNSAQDIHRLIRASSYPFSGAFSFTEHGDQVRIWRAELYDPVVKVYAVPGQILYDEKPNLVIACGDGALKLTEVSVNQERISNGKISKKFKNGRFV